MDPMYDFSMFQHGIHDTNKKLQYYRKFKALQEAMCASCRKKCGSSATGSGSQLFSTPNDSVLETHRHPSHIEDDTPIAGMDIFWTPEASSSGSSPINETNTMVEILAELSAENNDLRFYAQKDDLDDIAVEEDGQGALVVYEVESRGKYCELREYASQYGSYQRRLILSLCFSTDGRYLATGGYDSRVIIWDIPNRRICSIFQCHDHQYFPEIRFSPDGRFVAFRDIRMTLLILSVRDNSKKMVSQCSCFDFNPNGRHIATGNENGDLDIRTGKAVKRWNRHGTLVDRVQFNSDGKRLLRSFRGVVEHWDLNDAEPVLIWKADTEKYVHAISPENRLLTCSNELWEINSGKRQCALEGHNKFTYSDFSAAGTYLALADWSNIVSLWKYTWS